MCKPVSKKGRGLGIICLILPTKKLPDCWFRGMKCWCIIFMSIKHHLGRFPLFCKGHINRTQQNHLRLNPTLQPNILNGIENNWINNYLVKKSQVSFIHTQNINKQFIVLKGQHWLRKTVKIVRHWFEDVPLKAWVRWLVKLWPFRMQGRYKWLQIQNENTSSISPITKHYSMCWAFFGHTQTHCNWSNCIAISLAP